MAHRQYCLGSTCPVTVPHWAALGDAMKVYLQNGVTLAYLLGPGAWTSDAERAMLFEDSHSAIRFCLEHQLPDMRIVLHFPEFRHDVHMPVKLPRMV